MKKLLILTVLALFLLAGCSSVSTTHPDGSQTILYPDGRMEHIN